MSRIAQEILSWEEVEKLIDHLLPQFHSSYEALLLVTRGGIIPGGIIAEALDINQVLTAVVQFPSHLEEKRMAWPTFMQFPDHTLLYGKRILVVDDVWSSGRTITAVCGRVEAAGGEVDTAVLHYKPGRSLFKQAGPTYYAAITNAYIIYPWEIKRGLEGITLPSLAPC